MIVQIDTLSPAQGLAIGCAISLLVGASLGAWLGRRLDRRRRRDLERLLALRELDLLEVRARARCLDAALDGQERHHALNVAKLKLIAVRARNRARMADRAECPGAGVVSMGPSDRPTPANRDPEFRERRAVGRDRRARQLLVVPEGAASDNRHAAADGRVL